MGDCYETCGDRIGGGKQYTIRFNKLLYEIDGKKMYERTLEVVEGLCSGADEQTGTDKEPVENPSPAWKSQTVVTQYEEIAAAAPERAFCGL